MYSIVFHRFPDQYTPNVLQMFPKVDSSIMSHHDNLLEARQRLIEHAKEYVKEYCGRVHADNCEIEQPTALQIQDDGLFLYHPSCDVIELYEAKPVIREGYIYNTCNVVRRILGWFEVLFESHVPSPPPPAPPVTITQKGDTTYIDVVSELRDKFESNEVILRCPSPPSSDEKTDDSECPSYDDTSDED